MVRILVGTMLEIGYGKLPASALSHALFSLDRKDAGPTAPANGLILNRVIYDDFDTEEILSRAR
jgi:tRNA pseudouridine38-40 synthase